MGVANDRFEYLREPIKSGEADDAQKALYKKIRVFCAACNSPDAICISSVCHFYSLKPKAIEDTGVGKGKFGANTRSNTRD